MEADLIKTAFIVLAGIAVYIMTRIDLKTSNRIQKK